MYTRAHTGGLDMLKEQGQQHCFTFLEAGTPKGAPLHK